MLFHSPEFIALMSLTATVCYLAPGSRIPVLAIANAVFYGAAGWEYLLLFLAASAVTYYCSLRAGGPGGRWWVAAGVALNLLNLGYFKYTGWLLDTADRVLDLGVDARAWQVVLPVGISFYTFQLIAYLIDVGRDELPPARNLVEFWVFIAFFGQLIAGPIMRGMDFLPQIQVPGAARPDGLQARRGAILFTIGLAKKILLADMLAARADAFFRGAAELGAVEAWIAAYLFAFQIYYDFSAYSDMAVGIGHLFGYRLTPNFRTPYLAGNPSEFWRRWHITLSSWIRDYVYIPLGGSRRGAARRQVNLIAAMTLSGLWHGAAWTFVAWGAFHGLLAAGHSLLARHVAPRLQPWARGRAGRWLAVFAMFQATAIGWVFFRAEGLSTALQLIRKMVTLDELHLTRVNAIYLIACAGLYLLHAGEFWLFERARQAWSAWSRLVPAPVRGLAYSGIAVVLVLASGQKETPFIYFRF